MAQDVKFVKKLGYFRHVKCSFAKNVANVKILLDIAALNSDP